MWVIRAFALLIKHRWQFVAKIGYCMLSQFRLMGFTSDFVLTKLEWEGVREKRRRWRKKKKRKFYRPWDAVRDLALRDLPQLLCRFFAASFLLVVGFGDGGGLALGELLLALPGRLWPASVLLCLWWVSGMPGVLRSSFSVVEISESFHCSIISTLCVFVNIVVCLNCTFCWDFSRLRNLNYSFRGSHMFSWVKFRLQLLNRWPQWLGHEIIFLIRVGHRYYLLRWNWCTLF